jgi:uncharacterized protein GlcG (DUF336 family)
MIKGTIAAAVALLFISGTAFAVDASKLALPGDITIAQAEKVIAAAKTKAKEQGTLMDITVLDAGGNLKAFARMDGAFLGSIDVSMKKARTARYFNMSSKDLGDLAQPGKPLYGIEVTNDGLVIFGGGELIRDASGTIIGAIGVSGSSVEDDMAVAKAGATGL